jgi:hypothetical protein
MSSIVKVGLKPILPCVILFLEVQMEYITEVIILLSFIVNKGAHRMSLVHVLYADMDQRE